jgi:hypothetical protein
VLGDEAVDRLMADEGGVSPRDRSQAVVHRLEVQALQVRDVARPVERHDLAMAIPGELVPGGQPLGDQAAIVRLVAFAHHVRSGGEDTAFQLQLRDPSALGRGQFADALELADQPAVVPRRFGWAGHIILDPAYDPAGWGMRCP